MEPFQFVGTPRKNKKKHSHKLHNNYSLMYTNFAHETRVLIVWVFLHSLKQSLNFQFQFQFQLRKKKETKNENNNGNNKYRFSCSEIVISFGEREINKTT